MGRPSRGSLDEDGIGGVQGALRVRHPPLYHFRNRCAAGGPAAHGRQYEFGS